MKYLKYALIIVGVYLLYRGLKPEVKTEQGAAAAGAPSTVAVMK